MTTSRKKKSHRPEKSAVLLNTPVPANPGNPPPPGETDPVFTASPAAQFVTGDKAKLDTALQAVPGLTAVLQASNNAGGNTLTNVAAVNFTGSLLISTVSSVMRLDSNVPLALRAEHGPTIALGAAGLDCAGSVIANVQAPGADSDADTQVARNAALAAAFAPGITQDVTIAGVTLHIVNGLITGVS